MAVQVSYPGVYIDEFAPGAPIQGVGTNTAAFIGPSASGPLEEPTKVTRWEQFKQIFGADPLPGFFLWYAVRGFYENGGQVCYIVRASNGTYSTLDVDNRAAVPRPVFRVQARQPGAVAITISIVESHLLAAADASLYQPTGQLTGAVVGRTVTLNANQSGNFKPGDLITIAAFGERAQVVRVAGDTLIIDRTLTNAGAAADTVRLADAPPGQRTFRISYAPGALPTNGLVEGTMLTITQGGNSDTQIVESVQTEYLLANALSYRVTFRAGTRVPFDMTAAATVQSEEFDIQITAPAGSPPFQFLSMVPSHPNYVVRTVNNNPDALIWIELTSPPPVAAPPLNLPANFGAPTALTVGTAEDLTALGDIDYTRALDTLRDIDDVNLVAIPDRPTAVVQQGMIAHCELLMDRFAILDGAAGLPPFGVANSIEAQRRTVDSTRGYAGLYYPWLEVPPAHRGEPIQVPPSGHVCGIIARSDQFKGVHKAPANEFVNGAVGVARNMGDIDHGLLNLQGIDVVRVFNGGRPTLFGARTTATDRNWQYINIRRLFLFLEESIQEGIRWAVFEPNNLQLWQKLRRSIGDFLNRAWRDGALFGAKAEDAYYVRIDEALNPFSEQQLGRLNIEIGVRPSFPAEFIIVRIGIWPGGSEVTEG